MGENGPSLYQRPDYIVSKFGKDTIYQNDNPNTQIQSGYSQHNILQKITYKPNENIQFDYAAFKNEQMNRLADTVETVLPLHTLCELLGIAVPDHTTPKTKGDFSHD